MRKHGLYNGVWVLVCDGRKAMLLKNTGDADFPKLECRKTMQHPDLPSHALGADAPGKIVHSQSSQHSAVQEADLHRQAEEDFLKTVASDLSRELLAGTFKDIILVAPARALGTLRQAMSPMTRAAVRAEITKDYVRMPLYEIEEHLTQALASDG